MYFYKGKTVDRVHGLWTGGAFGPMDPRAERGRHSRARDLAVAAWGARGADGDPYPGWHKLVEGLGRPGVVEGRWRRSKLNEEVLGARG
jgi:hypothetical protein